MNFVVDTGATSVVIPLDLAREMGLPLGVEITQGLQTVSARRI